MNLKVLAKLRTDKNTFILEFQDQLIPASNIGWISEDINIIYEFLDRKYHPITEDDYILILDNNGKCYLEIQEVRNKATEWEGSAINSFSITEPVYTEEIVLKENKMILHFYRE